MDEPIQADGIHHHRAAIRLLTDDELVARIEGTEPLPDAADDDLAWDESDAWDRAEFLIEAAEEIGDRRLPRAIAPLFQKAALGDAYEMMRGLRHGPERAVAPDWAVLTSIMRPLTRYHRAGCRRWAVHELGILRDPDAVDDLLSALRDEHPLVRSEACRSLGMLSDAEPSLHQRIRGHLQAAAEHDVSSDVRRSARWALSRHE